VAKFAASAVDTDGVKISTSVVVTGGKFAIGVFDTSVAP
jgi:hypothetical protein